MLSNSKHLSELMNPARRKILRHTAGILASMALPCFAKIPDFWSDPRELWLFRPATGETVRSVYWADGELVPTGYIEICNLLRDTHANESALYDLFTLDITCVVSHWLQSIDIAQPIIVNSGYRTPKTNASENGVQNSFHTRAQAIDIRIDGVNTESVAKFGRSLSVGGVGFYPTKHFVHLDRGQVRYWRG